jgi:ferric-dicitrate binding protein FerR (iron transport regulator)
MILDEKHILLISKYLAKEATQEEIDWLNQWIASDLAYKAEFESYQQAWESSAQFEDIGVDIDMEWGSIKSKLKIGELAEAKVRALDPVHAERFSFKQALRIAAVILLLLIPAAGVYFFINQNKTIEVAALDSIKDKPMPDGSKITLNQESVITYPKNYGKENRQIALTGEAFFSVAPDKSKPFMVDVNEITVTVTGTSFYIDASLNENEIKVIVETGTVIVKSTLDPTQTLTLYKGDKAVYSRPNHTLTKQLLTEEENYHSWLTKKLLFKEIRLKDIVNDLNHAYHRNITIKDKEVENCRISVSFDQQSLKQILNVIENTIDVKITEKENSIEITGKGC